MSYYHETLSHASFRPAVYDNFALITRQNSRLSPALALFADEIQRHMADFLTDNS